MIEKGNGIPESWSLVVLDLGKTPKKVKPELKTFEIWIGFVYSWGQGDSDSTEPLKLGEVRATTFKIACCIYEHQSAIDSLNKRMEQGDTCIEDDWFGHWGYNPKDNSTFHLGKYFESKEEAWKSFKNR